MRSHSESTGGTKADLVLKVYLLLMREVLPLAANSNGNGTYTQHDKEFKYDLTMRRILGLEWSTDLRQLLEINFVQL